MCVSSNQSAPAVHLEQAYRQLTHTHTHTYTNHSNAPSNDGRNAVFNVDTADEEGKDFVRESSEVGDEPGDFEYRHDRHVKGDKEARPRHQLPEVDVEHVVSEFTQ